MARKSRKNQAAVTAAAPEARETVYNTALYLRLSMLDSGVKGGESIINQKDLLTQYVANKAELELKAVFTDNGETGVDYNRPAWNDLMRECRDGKINCIVVRDLSRLGRNYIETGELLEKVLPMLGVRLISVNDNYDNLHLTLNEQLVANLKNLVNDIYSKDISRKVSSAVRAKKKNGEFMGTYAAYGYLKDPLDKHKLIIDHDVAHNVVQIFEWKAEGLGNNLIAQKLNGAGIPCPNHYRLLKGIVKDKRYEDYIWKPASIKAIITNPVYIGNLAQGKKVSTINMGKRQKHLAPADWIIVEGTHEPIISHELYDKAHAVVSERTQKSIEGRKKHQHIENHPEILKGLVLCGDCGRSMPRVRRPTKNKYGSEYLYYLYHCRTNEELSGCIRKNMHEHILNTAVYEAIRIETQKCADIMPIIEKLNRENGHKSRLARFEVEIEEAKKELRRITSLKQAVFEDYATKLLTASEYQFAIEKYNADIEKLQQRLDMALIEKTEYTSSATPTNKWLMAFSRFMDAKELTADMVQALIERVEINGRDNITVVFKFRNEYKAVIEYTGTGVA